jgi:transcription antitermination factor NusG
VKESIEKRMKAEEMGEFIKEVLVPIEKVVDVRGGKKTVTSRKLHPGYVYIDMVLLDENKRVMEKPWYFIQETPGKIGFVGGDRPVPVTPEEIAVIKSQISESEDAERGNRSRARQVEDHGEYLRPQYAGRIGILAGGKSLTNRENQRFKILWRRRRQAKSNCKSRPGRPIPRRPWALRSASTASTSWASARSSTPPRKTRPA